MKIIVMPQPATARNESTDPAHPADWAAVHTDRVAGTAYVVHVDAVTVPGELSSTEWSALMGLS